MTAMEVYTEYGEFCVLKPCGDMVYLNSKFRYLGIMNVRFFMNSNMCLTHARKYTGVCYVKIYFKKILKMIFLS